MQGIEYNIAALRTIIFIIYAKVALLLPMEDQMYLAARSLEPDSPARAALGNPSVRVWSPARGGRGGWPSSSFPSGAYYLALLRSTSTVAVRPYV